MQPRRIAIHGLATRARAAGQRGFMLVELILYISLVALLSIYAASEITRASEESLAKGSGEYLQQVASAAQQHVLLNFNSYANNTAVPGVAVLLQPTVTELRALGRLNGGFPAGAGQMPTRQTARIDITRTGCPGATCSLQVLACTTTPVTLGGSFTRFDLASTMVDVQNGTGGQSLQNNGAFIRGAALNVANPLGNVEGVVCGSGSVDTAMLQQFLVLNDTRDPNFQGGLTVTGTTLLNNTTTVAGPLTATGTTSLQGTTTVGTCATILATTGRAGFGCTNPNDVPAGYTGGVRTPDLVASGRIVASDNPAAFTGANGNYAYVGVNAGVGEVRTSGRAQADRLVPTGAYAVGTACAAADAGAIARESGGTGLVICRSNQWRTLMTFATAGGACTPNGAEADDGTGAKMFCVNGTWQPVASLWAGGTPGGACTNVGTIGYDTANNSEALLCRQNPAGGGLRYMRMRDVTSHLTFVQSYEVTDISVGVASGRLTKPACSAAGGMSATALVQLIPKIYSSSDGGVALYAVDGGTYWDFYLRRGNNTALTGTPSARAIANVFCYFA